MVGIGIDLGTTSSCVAVWKDGDVVVIENEHGNKTTPSYVAFTPTRHLIGEDAKNQASLNPLNTIFAAKRLIGKRYNDLDVEIAMKYVSYTVINEDDMPKIIVDYKGKKVKYTPEEISGIILFKMKQIAETYLGTVVNDAVITVPAYFTDAERCATRMAGMLAGLKVLRIVNEPTAAALAYGLDRNLKGEKNVLVYDLGGGTFDVSVVTISEGALYEVKATCGDTRLGGEDFDNRIADYLVKDFHKRFGKDLSNDVKALRRLGIASERAKRTLSSAMEAIVELEALHEGIDYYGRITRELFEEMCSDLFQKTLDCVEDVIQDAKMVKKDISDIVTIGGSSRIHKARAMLQDFFDGKNLISSINPDEAVAYGAAILAAVIGGENHEKIQELLLVDIVPLSLGIESLKGAMFKVIDRNTVIPCCNTKEVSTLHDYQTSMTLEVYEGERSLTKDNNLLGAFELTGIPPAPRGVAKIDVTFNVDVNGILTVSAQDSSTGNTESIIIRNEHRLKQHEIDRMIADAEKFRHEDREIKDCLEVRNQLETYIYDVKNTVREKSDQLTEEEKNIMLNEIKDSLLWLETNVDCLREEYERKLTENMVRWHGIMNKFYDQNWLQKIKRQRIDVLQLAQMGEHSKSTFEEAHKS